MMLGNTEIKWIGHSGFFVQNKKRIYIDPYNLANFYGSADIILITHPHFDHCSLKDIEKIAKDGTLIAVACGCQSKIAKIDKKIKIELMEPGKSLDIDGIKIGAIPAYNLNKSFHTLSEGWVGFVIKIGDKVIYHAGDSDFIPEMKKLAGKVNVAMLPVDGKYAMSVDEAVEAALAIKPDLAVPMHASHEECERFVKLALERGIKAQML